MTEFSAAQDDRWQRWITGIRAGNGAVVEDFCRQYGTLLHRVADKHIAGALRRRLGPEDVVQSVCRTFFRRAQGGEFEIADSEALWRLLCAITLAKVREQARFHLRQKRGLGQEVDAAAGDGAARFDPVAPEPTPSELVEFADQFTQLLAQFDDEERRIVDLKLQEHTNEEVAERLGCSERTVRRVLKRVRAHLERAFEVA